MAELKLEDWFPMSPMVGPPLPKFLGIYWPWYKEEPAVYNCPYCEATFATQEERDAHVAEYHGVVPPLTYTCPYCDQSFASLPELIAHAAAVHPEKPPIGEITIAWE